MLDCVDGGPLQDLCPDTPETIFNPVALRPPVLTSAKSRPYHLSSHRFVSYTGPFSATGSPFPALIRLLPSPAPGLADSAPTTRPRAEPQPTPSPRCLASTSSRGWGRLRRSVAITVTNGSAPIGGLRGCFRGRGAAEARTALAGRAVLGEAKEALAPTHREAGPTSEYLKVSTAK